MAPGKDVEAIVQICLPFFFHKPHGFFLLQIPFILGYLLPIAYQKGNNGSWILELMQPEAFGIALRVIHPVKDVMVHPLYHRDAFGWGEEILRHDGVFGKAADLHETD